MKKVSQKNWPAVEREYRAGQLSVRQIAKLYQLNEASIRQRAVDEGWNRDLLEEINKATLKKLADINAARGKLTSSETARIVEDASDRAVQAVRKHREGILRITKNVNDLQTGLEGLIAKQAAAGEAADSEAIAGMQGTLESMARTMNRLIPLERQTYNLDGGNKMPGGEDEDGTSVHVYIAKNNRD